MIPRYISKIPKKLCSFIDIKSGTKRNRIICRKLFIQIFLTFMLSKFFKTSFSFDFKEFKKTAFLCLKINS